MGSRDESFGSFAAGNGKPPLYIVPSGIDDLPVPGLGVVSFRSGTG